MLSTDEHAGARQMSDVMTSADDLRKRILHLRWMGLDDEAERLCASLARTAVPNVILIGPYDTD